MWKTQQWPQGWKGLVFIPIPKKGNAKECSIYCTIVLISHASKVMLKILQARLRQYVNHELPDVQAGFRKGRGTRDQIVNIWWIIRKAKEFQKLTNSIYICISVYVYIHVYVFICRYIYVYIKCSYEYDNKIHITYPCYVETDVYRCHSFLYVQKLHMWWVDYNLYFKHLRIAGRHK